MWNDVWKFMNEPIFLVVVMFLIFWLKDKAIKKTGPVSRKECEDYQKSNQRFKKRLGDQVDIHEELLSKIKGALVFLVTKAGGNPSDYNLYG